METSALAEIFNKYPKEPRHLLPILFEIQGKDRYLSIDAMEQTAAYLGIPDSQVFAAATFYRAFTTQKKGRIIFRVCMGTACHLHGAAQILHAAEQELGIKNGETTPDGNYSIEGVNCVGACAHAPLLIVGEKGFPDVSPDDVHKIIKEEAVL